MFVKLHETNKRIHFISFNKQISYVTELIINNTTNDLNVKLFNTVTRIHNRESNPITYSTYLYQEIHKGD